MRTICALRRLVQWLIVPGGAVVRLLSLVSLLGLLSLAAAQADGPNRVGLVVAHDDKVITRCIEFSEAEISGYEILRRANLDLNVDVSSGMGGAVCRIDGQGCTYPQEDCFCQCQGNPCRFWIYWHLVDGDWRFSGLGASTHKVRHGDVEGWIWGEGSPNSGGVRPPRLAFEEICAEPPTATATLTHTPAPPTPTPKPGDTPTPVATPVIHRFTADRYSINAGESIVLSWDLSNARAAFLRHNGIEEGVIAPGSKTVSPDHTTIYTLAARNNGGEALAEITITVVGAPPPSNSIPTSTPLPVTAPAQAAVPTPVISLNAGSLTVPAGACTNVYWSVQQAEAVFLDDQPVARQGTQPVCPPHTQTVRLRALYAKGEKATELVLNVADPPSLPTAPPTPVLADAVTPQFETVATLPPATPVARAVWPTAADEPPAEPRRFAVPTENSRSASTGMLWYGVVVVALGLFVVAPVALIAVGWVVWWLKSNRRFSPFKKKQFPKKSV